MHKEIRILNTAPLGEPYRKVLESVGANALTGKNDITLPPPTGQFELCIRIQ